jgi:peptidoglycan/xylan/chitin deacetylase (PgdA/CDA1 family)
MTLFRRVANRGKDYLLFNQVLESYWLSRARGKVTALLYHRVDMPQRNPFLARGGSPVIAPDAFRADMEFLLRNGARFFTFGQLAAGEYSKADEFGVAICFDDCFADNYTHGLDVLQDCGIRATLFQATAMVEARELIWEHRLYWHTRDDARAAAFKGMVDRMLPQEAQRRSFAPKELVEYLRETASLDTCQQVLEAADTELASGGEMEEVAERIYPTAAQLRHARSLGHEIGSHGHHHYKRANISASIFERELTDSHTMLGNILGEPPRSFSYPFDSHTPSDAGICRRYYKAAATVAKRRIERDTDPMWLPRFTWPGPSRNAFRQRRWLLTGTI